jgi:hypothetical protein
VVAGGGTGITSGTAYGVVCAGTTSTGPFQVLASLGNAGEQLTSNGPGALPTWQPSSTVTPSALTRVDDTNVTLTLGGTPATSLLQAVSITAGWSGQLSPTRGGTGIGTYTLGDTLYCSAANVLSKLAGNTTTAKQYLSQTGDGVNSAAPAWATIDGGDITGAALTRVDDTNVTLTLGGTPTTSLLRAASLTLGWTGQLGLTRGGTNASLTASNGGIVWSNATQLQILSGTATAGQILRSGASATPSWSTATYPATAGTSGNVLTSDGTNWSSSAPVGATVTIADDTTTNATMYPVWVTASTGNLPAKVSSTKLSFNPSTATLTCTNFAGNSSTVTNGVYTTSQVTALTTTSTNDNAASGKIGEFVSSQITAGSAVSVTSATNKNVTSISLTAGDWDVWGNVSMLCAGTTLQYGYSWISSTSATLPDDSLYAGVNVNTSVGKAFYIVAPSQRFSLSGTTTVYLQCQSAFASSTCTAAGYIAARRIR